MQTPATTGTIWDQPQVVAAIITATGTLLSAILVGVVGAFITKWFARARDRQDRESQWRSHAIELTKLEIQRKLSTRQPGDQPMRPSVLDFLANYRDLQELGQYTPKELYQKISKDRIATSARDAKPSVAAAPNSSEAQLPSALAAPSREDPFGLDPVLNEALRAAAEYARYLGSGSVEPEHILLGFLRTGDPVFQDISNAALRERILEKVQQCTPIEPSQELPFAAAAIKALGLAKERGDEVRPLRPAAPGSVLFAILNDSDSLAAGVLRSAGITSQEQIRLRSA